MNHRRPRPINVGASLSIITDAQLIQEIEADFSPEKPQIKVEGTRKRKERELKCVNGLVMPVGLSPAKMVPTPLFREIKEDRMCKKQRPFEYPTKYITYDEPTPDEEEHIIDYDMDSDDESFLSTLNKQSSLSKAKHLACLKHEEFESLFDLFEKTHQKIKEGHLQTFSDEIAHLFRVVGSDDVEDATCAVCNDGEYSDDNMIIFCDGCNIGVHQLCYGLKEIPSEEFYCDRCRYMRDLDQAKHLSGKYMHLNQVRCEFCPVTSGAFKPLVYLDKSGKQLPRWAHVTCAMWIAECSFADTETMDPIFAMKVPSRNKYTCCVCSEKSGVCVKCCEPNCSEYFHVMCGRTRDYSIYARPAHVKQEKTSPNNIKNNKTKKTKQQQNKDYNDNIVDGDKVEFVQYCSAHSLKSEIQRTDSHFGFSSLSDEELGELDVFVTSQRGLTLPAYSTELVYWYWRRRKRMHPGSFLRKFQALTPLAAFLDKYQITGPECLQKLALMRQHLETARILLDQIKKREHLKKELLETTANKVGLDIARLNEYVEWCNSPRKSPRKPTAAKIRSYQEYEEEDDEEEEENIEQTEQQQEQIEQSELKEREEPTVQPQEEYGLPEQDLVLIEGEEFEPQQDEVEDEEQQGELEGEEQPELMEELEEAQPEEEASSLEEEEQQNMQMEEDEQPDLIDQKPQDEDVEVNIVDEEVDNNVSSGGELEAPAPGSVPMTPTRNAGESDSDVSGAEESFDSFDLERRVPIKLIEEHKQRLSKLESIKNGFMRGGTIDEPIVIDDEEPPKKKRKREPVKQGSDSPKKRRKKRKKLRVTIR